MNNHNHKPQPARNRCQTTLQVNKITKRLISRNPVQSKKHCPQDEACFHCCQCWVKFKEEYEKRIKYFETKVSNDEKQIVLLKSIIERLTKESVELKKKVRNTSDLETIKENLREELRKEINDDIKANDLIQKQKIKSLSESLKQKEEILAEINEKIRELEDKNWQLSKDLKEKQSQCEQLQNKLDGQVKLRLKVQQKNKQLESEIEGLNSQILTLRGALKQKDLNISGLKSTIDYSDKLISIKSTELSQKDFQKTKIQLESSYKSQVLQKMQTINQQNSKSISQLENDKWKLNELVGSLKEELLVTDNHKHILKMALGDAQSIAMEKSISLQSLKHDVRMMKYTLPQILKENRFFSEA